MSIKSINAGTKQNLDYLINPSFQGVNRLFVLFFEHNIVRAGGIGFFFPKINLSETTSRHITVLENLPLVKETITKIEQRIKQQKIKLQ